MSIPAVAPPPLDVSAANLAARRRQALQQLVLETGQFEYLRVTAEGLVNDRHDYNNFTDEELRVELTTAGFALIEELGSECYCSFHDSVADALASVTSSEVQWIPLWLYDLDDRRAHPVFLRAVLAES